jgi:hypothetical protein
MTKELLERFQAPRRCADANNRWSSISFHWRLGQIDFLHFTNNSRLPNLNWLAGWLAGWLENFDHFIYAMHFCDSHAFTL